MSDDNNGAEIQAEIGGQKVRTKGYRAVDIVLIILTVGVFGGGYLTLQEFKDARRLELERITAEHVHLLTQMAQQTLGIKALETATQEQTYVLTLDPKRREALNLDMPDTLRRRVWEQERDRSDSRRTR